MDVSGRRAPVTDQGAVTYFVSSRLRRKGGAEKETPSQACLGTAHPRGRWGPGFPSGVGQCNMRPALVGFITPPESLFSPRDHCLGAPEPLPVGVLTHAVPSVSFPALVLAWQFIAAMQIWAWGQDLCSRAVPNPQVPLCACGGGVQRGRTSKVRPADRTWPA